MARSIREQTPPHVRAELIEHLAATARLRRLRLVDGAVVDSGQDDTLEALSRGEAVKLHKWELPAHLHQSIRGDGSQLVLIAADDTLSVIDTPARSTT